MKRQIKGILALGGLASIFYGCYLFWPPIAFLFLGWVCYLFMQAGG